MAWTSPMTAVANATFTAAQFNANVRDNLNETAPAKASAAAQLIVATGANAIAARTVQRALVATNQSTTSSSYVDLTTPGPAITITTGTQAVIGLVGKLANATGGNISHMGFAISGATTLAAADETAIDFESSAAADEVQCSLVQVVTGLTAGNNTFTAKYKANAGTAFFTNRQIWGFGL